jgi:oligoendopeptidase F
MQAARRGDFPRLRTRIGEKGMDYKGYNVAVHELGHNVEQVISLYDVDHTLLAGVPNTAFTEALAFVFQARDMEVLGLGAPDPEARRLLALNDLWMAYEISGVALVDIGVWRWMYQHPRATPAEAREATLRIAREVWNRWYAPVLGVKDSPLLAIYSHMIHSFLYLPDYPLGHLISSQIEAHLSARPPEQLGAEVERMTRVGRVAPDLWMQQATGAPVSAEPLLLAARRALQDEPRR